MLDGLRRSWQLTAAQLVADLRHHAGGFPPHRHHQPDCPDPDQPCFRRVFLVVAPHGGDDGQRALGSGVGIATAVVSALVGAVGFAFQTSVMGLLYMDLRMRKEGLDIALLRLLESGTEADGVPGRGIAPERNAGRPAPRRLAAHPYGPPPGYGPPRLRPAPGLLARAPGRRMSRPALFEAASAVGAALHWPAGRTPAEPPVEPDRQEAGGGPPRNCPNPCTRTRNRTG